MTDTVARALFKAEDPTGIWEAADYGTQYYYRVEAERQREKIMQELADEAQKLGLGY